MAVLRNRFAEVRSGGPRQFSELRNKIIIDAVSFEDQGTIIDELRDFNLDGSRIQNSPIIIAQPADGFTEVIESFRETISETDAAQAIQEVSGEEEIIDIGDATLRVTNQVINRIRGLSGVGQADFALSYVDYGPENLRLSLSDMPTVNQEFLNQSENTLEDLSSRLNLNQVWENERGEESIVAIFDTAYAEGIIEPDRIIDTFHDDSVDSVYESSEGHGTMTAGAAAASNEWETPFNGAAPGSDVILVRITNADGQIAGDVISNAWDYILNLNTDRPIITNHSYGTPLCSGRPKTRFCNKPHNELIEIATSESSITSVYAAGNEAMQCGHRPSGLTNAITGTNSLNSVITVGALRLDGREAQKYSSHGRGDCSPIADPKPNVSCAIPMNTYYGDGDGWTIKDMSTGIGGSSGGTSHASPTVAGMIALLQSKAVKERGRSMQTEEIKQIIQNTADLPHATPVNKFGFVLSSRGFDARFGHGQIDIVEALNEV